MQNEKNGSKTNIPYSCIFVWNKDFYNGFNNYTLYFDLFFLTIIQFVLNYSKRHLIAAYR